MIVCFKKLERVPNHGFPFTKCTSFITPVTGAFARRPVTRELELSFFVIGAKPQGDHPQVMAGERQVPYRNWLAVSNLMVSWSTFYQLYLGGWSKSKWYEVIVPHSIYIYIYICVCGFQGVETTQQTRWIDLVT